MKPFYPLGMKKKMTSAPETVEDAPQQAEFPEEVIEFLKSDTRYQCILLCLLKAKEEIPTSTIEEGTGYESNILRGLLSRMANKKLVCKELRKEHRKKVNYHSLIELGKSAAKQVLAGDFDPTDEEEFATDEDADAAKEENLTKIVRPCFKRHGGYDYRKSILALLHGEMELRFFVPRSSDHIKRKLEGNGAAETYKSLQGRMIRLKSAGKRIASFLNDNRKVEWDELEEKFETWIAKRLKK